MAISTKDPKKSSKDAVKKLKSSKVRLVFVVDASGSMAGKEEAVTNGINEFLATFRKQDDIKTKVWLSQFDSHPGEPRTRVLIDNKKLSKVDDLTIGQYQPRGMTPLNDAIMDAIDAAEKGRDDDEKVFMVMLTDGYENASETSADQVKKAITKRESSDHWEFLYLGANQNAQQTAAGLGLHKSGQAIRFDATPVGTSSSIMYASNDALMYSKVDKASHTATRSRLANTSADQASIAKLKAEVDKLDQEPDTK
jgi:uncharacterized protein YegL